MGSVTFCPKCGSMMRPRKSDRGVEMVCIRCGNVILLNEGAVKVEAKVSVANKTKSKIVVTKEESSLAEKVKGIVCSKCGNDEAFFWMVQTRAADEPPTRFYRCTRCGHTWREYA